MSTGVAVRVQRLASGRDPVSGHGADVAAFDQLGILSVLEPLRDLGSAFTSATSSVISLVGVGSNEQL